MGIDVSELGRRITRLRELRGESQHSLAGRASVAKSYLAKLERGDVSNPGLQTLHAIASALDTSVADLAGISPTRPRPVSSEIEEYQRLLDNLPPGLADFLDAFESSRGERLPADVVKSLAQIQFRGKRPRTPEDWRFVYDALMRSIDTA